MLTTRQTHMRSRHARDALRAMCSQLHALHLFVRVTKVNCTDIASSHLRVKHIDTLQA